MKTVAIAQARMGSTRAPGKVMRDLGGIPVLQWTINALRSSRWIDEIVLATSTLEADDVIEIYCKTHKIECFRGSETDVLDRFYQCAKKYKANVILRLTCDCPFLDSDVISGVIKLRQITGAAYASNTDPPTYPDGLDVECFTIQALEAAHAEAVRPTDRDCVTQFITRNRHRFPAVNLTCPIPGLRKERWVLDTEADYLFCDKISDMLDVYTPSYLDILEIVDKNPSLRNINPGERNERFYEGLAEEKLPRRTFVESEKLFKRAIQTIPFGAQTFSKSYLQFPAGRAPLFVSHGDGARIFDVDGNDYVDLVNALLPVVLGYRDPDVDAAIRTQLDNGISFSLATELEANLSERLCELIPCAEMVKFGKSGTDVTTAAVRLARAYTNRDIVFVGGYHGWSDWSIGVSERNIGVPVEVKNLSRRLKYGEEITPLNSDVYPSQIAAIIVEPNGDVEYLDYLREFCTQHGIVLIFDEIITGFRYDLGGAQKLFNVTPDLATFGKSMANGMPISALVGKRDIMKRMSPPDNIFYSGTFFGETLSIAAALATINKMEREDVIGKLWNRGTRLEVLIVESLALHGLKDFIKIGGEAPRLTIDFTGEYKEQIKNLFICEMIQNGVLIINSNNLSYSHNDPELDRIVKAYDASFEVISAAISNGRIKDVEISTPVSPLRAAE